MLQSVCSGTPRRAGSAVVVVALASPAFAEDPYVLFSVHAAGESSAGGYTLAVPAPGPGLTQWTLEEPVDLLDSETGEPIARLDDAGVTLHGGEPHQVSLWFSIQADDEDAEIWVGTEMVSFPMIDAAQGIASVAMTVTDGNGDGASISGGAAAGYCSTHWYNGEAPDGRLFLESLPLLETGPGGTATATDDTNGWQQFPAPTENMSLLFNYVVTAGDLASGTSTYVIQALPAGDNGCDSDVNGDGMVDVADLVEVILHWGEEGGDADVNDDGVVGVYDFQQVMLDWGTC